MTTENLCAIWHASSRHRTTTLVLPDGCRDLIVRTVGSQKPVWFISPLFDRCQAVQSEANSRLTGFRLKPGVSIDQQGLLNAVQGGQHCRHEVQSIIDDFTRMDPAVDEALACLAGDIESVRAAALRLGVSIRTLQRLLGKKTARSPCYWFQLSRVRKAARSVGGSTPLAEIAARFGYADQSHMTREFQRWFATSPARLLAMPSALTQLEDQAYS